VQHGACQTRHLKGHEVVEVEGQEEDHGILGSQSAITTFTKACMCAKQMQDAWEVSQKGAMPIFGCSASALQARYMAIQKLPDRLDFQKPRCINRGSRKGTDCCRMADVGPAHLMEHQQSPCTERASAAHSRLRICTWHKAE